MPKKSILDKLTDEELYEFFNLRRLAGLQNSDIATALARKLGGHVSYYMIWKRLRGRYEPFKGWKPTKRWSLASKRKHEQAHEEIKRSVE